MSTSETSVASKPDATAQLLHPQELQAEIIEERRGIAGAAVIAGIAVGLLLLGWLFFYFGLYLRRG